MMAHCLPPCVAPGTAAPVGSLTVAFERKPFDIFVLSVAGEQLVGLKTEACFDPAHPSAVRKCGLVEPPMVLGLLLATRVTAQGYTVYWRPVSMAHAARRFEEAATDPLAELSYPFARIMPGGAESAKPAEFWDPQPAFATLLDDDELFFRGTALDVLRTFGVRDGVAFDPACSTGAFLASLKAALPALRVIGQDRSAGMVRLARTRLDEVHGGDSVVPALGPASADLLVLRHLNVDVVTSAQAELLFQAAAATLRLGGLCLVFGHTPVLLAAAWFEQQGFDLLSRVASTPTGHALFEFYVLRKASAPCAALQGGAD